MVLEEIAEFLQASGESTLGTDLFFAGLPDLPDVATALWEYGGEVPLHVKRKQSPVLEYPRVQVITRAKVYTAAREKAERIYRLLDGFKGEMSGVSYGQIRAVQQPFFLDRDDKGRYRIACNYQISKALSPLTA